MGVWTWGGSSKRWISVDEEGDVTFLKKCQTAGKGDTCYLVWKRYYHLKSSPDVKRMIIILEGKSGLLWSGSLYTPKIKRIFFTKLSISK